MAAKNDRATMAEPPLRPKTRVCFSFAAYCKDLLLHIHHNSNVPIAEGLTETEVSAIESAFHFSFPPDLRSILQEGLPVGPGFPNWRSSSSQQLEILTNLPILGLCKEVRRQKFWHRGWGGRPEDDDEAVGLAKGFLKKSPLLVPVYRNFYIPTTPRLAGNPVFYVNGLDVKLWSYDVVGFFQQTDLKGNDVVFKSKSLSNLLRAPVWAATEARRIEFWTELVEVRIGGNGERRRRRWWWPGNDQLGRCLEEVWWKLRDGGWKEEDVEEMMEMDDRDDRSSSSASPCSSFSDDDGGGNNVREALGWHVRGLSLKLLRAGWSRGDVVESLGFLDEDGPFDDHLEEDCLFELKQHQKIQIGKEGGDVDGNSKFEFERRARCVRDGQRASLRQLMKINSSDNSIRIH